MDDFFKHRKRKATIVIDSEEVDSESKSNAKSYDKRMKTNGFSTANISDRISSMQKRKPNGDWRRFGKLTFSYTTITQLWKFEGKECKILHFCPWGVHGTIMKRLSSLLQLQCNPRTSQTNFR